MDRRMVGLAVAAMVIVASVAGLSWYRDDVRSEMVPVNGDIVHGTIAKGRDRTDIQHGRGDVLRDDHVGRRPKCG